jgi:predicted small lipoprotein YifL
MLASSRSSFPRFALALFVAILLAAIAAACGSSGNSGFPSGAKDASTGSSSGGDGSGGGDGPNLLGDGAAFDANGPLVISPANKAIDVNYGQTMPRVTYTASIGGATVHASFAIDLGQIGSIDASTGVMTPTGRIGGTANVTATYGAQKASTQVTVRIHMSDNGAPSGYDAGGGTGGYGGVGGSGVGGPVSSGGQTVLTGQPTADMGLSWLYPYDKTVWPQGVLPPLLQWQPGAVGSYDAVMIELQEKGFIYQGLFSAPAMPFVNHPILPSAWDTLVYSNQGENVTVTLVFSSGAC